MSVLYALFVVSLEVVRKRQRESKLVWFFTEPW